jgi:hypothetical protein
MSDSADHHYINYWMVRVIARKTDQFSSLVFFNEQPHRSQEQAPETMVSWAKDLIVLWYNSDYCIPRASFFKLQHVYSKPM